MAAICCKIQHKRSAIAAKCKTKEVKQKSAIIFKVCHKTEVQLGCLDGMPSPFTMPIKKQKKKTVLRNGNFLLELIWSWDEKWEIQVIAKVKNFFFGRKNFFVFSDHYDFGRNIAKSEMKSKWRPFFFLEIPMILGEK